MAQLSLKVVTPDKLIFEGKADRLLAKGLEGQFMVLPRHLPMVTLLGIGELRIDSGDESFYIAIEEGVLEVAAGDIVTILANDAVAAEDIDMARIKMDLDRQERNKQNIKSREEMIRQEVEISKLMNQLRVGQRIVR